MAREINKLSARSVTTISKPGRHSDGGGLYLVVDPSGARRWLFMFRWQGKLKEMGLGGVNAVSLADARIAAAEARKFVQAGTNPIEHRRASAPAIPNFAAMAEALVDSIASGLRSAKHVAQWRMTLSIERGPGGELLDTGYCLKLRNKLVSDISTEDVLAVLQPAWTKRAETASRVRGRIERVLDAAKAKGHRAGENPARWRGHLDQLLARRKKVEQAHHDAMPYADVPAFIAELREWDAPSALALEFAILCASRTGEVTGATWGEIDRKTKVWTIPPERMKGGREHRVPLGPRALEILDAVEKSRGDGDWIFPGPRKGEPMSRLSMAKLLKDRMKKTDCTVHGFRSSFRDWADEQTSFPHEIAEAALAHLVGSQVSRAYRRGDALEKRRRLMLAWEQFVCGAKVDNVVSINAG
jgi:integrase